MAESAPPKGGSQQSCQADVVGYSRLMGIDEAGRLSRV